MASFMGRSGTGSGATARALSPLRSRFLGSPPPPPVSARINWGRNKQNKKNNNNYNNKGGNNYLSMDHLRALHSELVAVLDDSTAVLVAVDSFSTATSGGDGGVDSGGGATGGPPQAGSRETAKAARRELQLIEILRSIAELVAFGEAGERPEYFEFFCEKAMMALFVKALRLGSAAVKTQVVQAISILFQNLRSPTSLYMLLSQDHINRLIHPEEGSAPLPLQDEEFLTNYVALLKAISVRLGKDTVQFFFNNTKGSFPLYSRSVPLIAHPDSMVRTSALNIALHVFSVEDPGVVAFLALEENRIGFFQQISRLLQDAYSQILCRVWQAREPSAENKSMDGATHFFQDMLYYVQDILDATSDPFLSQKLALHLHRTFFRPVVLEGFAEAVEGRGGRDDGRVSYQREPEVQLALYALCQVFILTTDQRLLGLVAADLFGFSASETTSAPAPQERRGTRCAAIPGGREEDVTAADRPRKDASRAPTESREEDEPPAGWSTRSTSCAAVGGGGQEEHLPTGKEEEGRGGGGAGAGGETEEGANVGRKGGYENGFSNGMEKMAATCLGVFPGQGGDLPYYGNDEMVQTQHKRQSESDESGKKGQKQYLQSQSALTSSIIDDGGGRKEEGKEEEDEKVPGRYRRALLDCVVAHGEPGGEREKEVGEGEETRAKGSGAQTARLGAIAAVRCAVRNPVVRGLIILKGRSSWPRSLPPRTTQLLATGGNGNDDATCVSGASTAKGVVAAVAFAGKGQKKYGDKGAGPKDGDYDDDGDDGDDNEDDVDLLDFSVFDNVTVSATATTTASATVTATSISATDSGGGGGGDGVVSVCDDDEDSRSEDAIPLLARKSGRGRGEAASTSTANGNNRGELSVADGGVVDGTWGGNCHMPPLTASERLLPLSPPGSENKVISRGGLVIYGGGGGGDGGDAIGDELKSASACNGSGSAGRGGGFVERHECFEEVMLHLLHALTNPPDSTDTDLTAVRTAAAAVEELFHLQESNAFRENNAFHENNAFQEENASYVKQNHHTAGGYEYGNHHDDGTNGGRVSSESHSSTGDCFCERGAHKRSSDRFVLALTKAYVQSAEVLLSMATSLQPFTLLSACERAVELLGLGVVADGDVRTSSPPPPLTEITSAAVLLVEGKAREGGRAEAGTEGTEAIELAVLHVQVFLVIRHLHTRLVEDKRPASSCPLLPLPTAETPTDPAAGGSRENGGSLSFLGNAEIGAFATTTTMATKQQQKQEEQQKQREGLGCGNEEQPSVRVDGEFLRLVGLKDAAAAAVIPAGAPVAAPAAAPSAAEAAANGDGDGDHDDAFGTRRLGDCIRLSSKRCVACSLPFNWPEAAVVVLPAPTRSKTDTTADSGTAAATYSSDKNVQRKPMMSPLAAAAAAANGAGVNVSANAGGLPTAGGSGSSGSSSSSSSGPNNNPPSFGGTTGVTTARTRSFSRTPASTLNLDSLELYVVFDEQSFLLAVPDPGSPLDDGLLLCVAPLRHTVAETHPANPRVVELRVSTQGEGRLELGPGLFLPVSSTKGEGGATARAAASGRSCRLGEGDGGASFRGAGHKGLWHLVLSFESANASSLVAEHVEEQRGALLAARTVELVEMFRRVASLADTDQKVDASSFVR